MTYSTDAISTKKNMFWNSFGSLTYFGCQWLMTVLVVRLSGGFSDAGVLALVMSIYNIFQPFASYRLYTFQVSDVTQENTTGEYLAFRTITCFGAFSVCALYAFGICSFGTFLAVVLFCLFSVISLLIEVWHAKEQLSGRMDYMGKSLALQGALSLGSFSAVLYTLHNIQLAILSMVVATLMVAILYDLPRYSSFERFHFGISLEKAIVLIRQCFPIVLSAVAFSAALSIGRQYLSYLYGEDLLGIYASIAAPAAIVQMGATYIYTPLLSIFAQHYINGNKKAIIHLFRKTVVGILLVGMLATALLRLLAPWIFPILFGSDIQPYLYLLEPIMGLTVVTAFAWFANDLLVAMRSFVGSVAGNVFALIVAIPSTYYCVNVWDMNGVSIAGIIACIAGLLVMVCFLNREVSRVQE